VIDTGIPLPDQAHAALLLLGLPLDRYEVLVQYLKITTDMNVPNIKGKLLLEDNCSRRPGARTVPRDTEYADADADARVLAAGRRFPTQKSFNANPKRRQPKNVVCYACGERYHIAKSCPKFPRASRSDDNDGRMGPPRRGGIDNTERRAGHIATKVWPAEREVDQGSNSDWVMDSGATHHLCAHKDLFDNLQEGDYGKIEVESGARIEVRGQGSVTLRPKKGYGGTDVTLWTVFFVPDLKANLLSVGCTEQFGARVTFRDGCFGRRRHHVKRT